MQTFLPYPDFYQSAKCLDVKRLCKQRLEVKQIYRALTEPTAGWKNHPAVKMWQGYEKALLFYGNIVCREWVSRGYKDSLLGYFYNEYINRKEELVYPFWFADPEFHRSHQSNLVRKMPTHYRAMFPEVPDNLTYVWPKKG